jgi:O-antigen/teichoic acid export membrane protein
LNEADTDSAGTRHFLRRLSNEPNVPAIVRRAAARIEGSNVAYRLAHGAFWSVAGATLSRVLVLTGSVITARLLDKKVYGELGILNSTLIMLQAFAGLGLGLTATRFVAEFRNKDPARAGRILALTAVVGTGTGVVAAVLLYVFAPWLAVHTIDAPQLAEPLRIAAPGLIFTTLVGVQAGVLSGFEAFKSITRLGVWSGLITLPLTVTGVYFWGLKGAVWGTVLASAVQWLIYHATVRVQAKKYGIPIGFRGWNQEKRVLWTFSVPALVAGLMVTPVMWAAQAMLVNEPHGYPEMGALSAANQWYGAVMFLPTALGGAILPVLSERVGQGDSAGSSKVLRTAIGMNTLVVAPVVLLGCLASPFIMGLYGEEFRSSWPTLVVVLITAAIVGVTNPVGNILTAAGRLWLGFMMNAGWALVLLAGTFFLVKWGALGVASARLLAYVVHSTWTIWYAAYFIRKGLRPSPSSVPPSFPPEP